MKKEIRTIKKEIITRKYDKNRNSRKRKRRRKKKSKWTRKKKKLEQKGKKIKWVRKKKKSWRKELIKGSNREERMKEILEKGIEVIKQSKKRFYKQKERR